MTTENKNIKYSCKNPVILEYSDHDVYAEYLNCCGTQKHYEAEYFIATMTPEDNRKMTLQLINMQCDEKCISVGDSYRRLHTLISEKRSWGELSHLVIR